MKTSKPMQLKIIDKMRENVENDNPLFYGIAYLDGDHYCIDFILHQSDFYNFEFIIKPETITINGVEIPKPLSDTETENYSSIKTVYLVNDDVHMYRATTLGSAVNNGNALKYITKEEAIEASKLLFGIKD